MSFRYFAYGSNLWPPQMRSRCPSARVVGPATLTGWTVVYDKPSSDGSAKLNIRPDPGGAVEGVIFDIEDGDRQALEAAEPDYTPIVVELRGHPTVTFTFEGAPHTTGPYDWYVAVADLGAASHGLTERLLTVDPVPDPVASGVRPATLDDMDLVQGILSEGIASGSDRYYIHPGDFAWWVYHDDPRHPDHFSTWLQGDEGFVTIDSIKPHEINVFTRSDVDRMPLINWAQRRLDQAGDVGWVADSDGELIDQLGSDGYGPAFAFRSYEWDLEVEPPDATLPDGWTVRHVASEREANTRRAAAHAAFESTMPAAMHLQRYLAFMRSPVYVPERDLVVVTPDGSVASFMIWWADPESGVAQIEPFGTHPDYQGRGIGRALIYHALREMRASGMRKARVCTEDDRPATGFYEACGFVDVDRLRWWRPTIGLSERDAGAVTGVQGI